MLFLTRKPMNINQIVDKYVDNEISSDEATKLILKTFPGNNTIAIQFAEWISVEKYMRCITGEWIHQTTRDFKAKDTLDLFRLYIKQYIESIKRKEIGEHVCKYSKSMNQPYPRLCVICGKPEKQN